jgi:hypothetical protein
MRLHSTIFTITLLLLSQTSVASKEQILKQTEFGTGVKVGNYLTQYHDTCVWFRVFFVSSEFFVGLKKGKSAFEKDHTKFTSFPEPLTIDVEALVTKCNGKLIPPDYGSGLMEQTSFDLAWKAPSLPARPAKILSLKQSHAPGLRWDYILQISGKDVPLRDTLLFDISLRNGIIHAHFPVSLK